MLALACLLCLGAGHRWVHSTRTVLAGVFTPPAQALAEFPTRLGPYLAVGDVPLQQDLLQASAVDSFVNRAYADPDSDAVFVLYVGYWGRENIGMGHGPEVCYPATGWQAGASRTAEIVFNDPVDNARRNAEVGIHRFTFVEPQGIKRHVVGFAAITNGIIMATSRDSFWHGPAGSDGTAGRYLAHVQVVRSVEAGNWKRAESEVEAFLATVIPTIGDFLPRGDAPVQMGD